jgi:hypothetical protein
MIYILSWFFFGCILTLYFFDVKLFLLYLLGITLAAIYDAYSKKIGGMDFILGASVVTGVVFGAATVSFQFSNIIYVFCVLAFLQTLNLNLIAGGLKDADHDYLINSRHLSTQLGLHAEDGVFYIPNSFKIIAYLFGFIYAFFVIVPSLLGIIHLSIILLVIIVLINVTFFFVTYKMLSLKIFDRQKVRKYVVLQFTINWSNIPILLASVAPMAIFLLLYPVIGLVVSNAILYKTVIRPQVL